MPRLLILIALLLAAVSPVHASKRVALVIGNGDYADLGRLPNPARDAEGIKKLLTEELGFLVISRIDAGHAELHRALVEFGRAADGADIALFFYAGHGIELDGANYLLPVGAELSSDVDLVTQGFRLDQVIETMVRSGAKAKIALIDACRNNPLPSRLVRGARSIGLRAAPITSVDLLIAFATRPGEVAYDGDGEHSPFTAGLLRYLATPDTHVTSTLYRVRSDVYQATNQRQFPWWDDMFMSEIHLLSADRQQPVESADSADIAACNTLGDQPTRTLMEAYVSQYPRGFCAAAFQERLYAKLEPESQSATRAVQVEPSAAEGEAAGVAGAPTYAVSSYWIHNGSVLALSAQGSSRAFYYESPRNLMSNIGVRHGTLLFKGHYAKGRYEGQAHLFSAKCAPIAYPVSGEVSSDFLTVVLRGKKPVRDQNCRHVGTKDDLLVFRFRSKPH